MSMQGTSAGRRGRLRGTLRALAVPALLALGFWVGLRHGGALVAKARELWEGGGTGRSEPAASPAGEEATTYYTCGMHPWVVLPRPGDCPICHMELTPIDPAKFTGDVVIDPTVIQNIGVRSAPVVLGPLSSTIRTVGTVAYDETTLSDVNTKVAGWIERLGVDSLGAPVTKGEELLELYSPALYEAEEQYLLAAQGEKQLGADVGPEAKERARRLVEDSRTRLSFYDLTDAQIDEIARSERAQKALPLLSPWSGVVVEKNATEGMRVEPGTRLYRIADLSRLWVIATIYEQQLPFVQVGQDAVVRLPYLPGVNYPARVSYVYPYVDERTRQVSVRLELANPEGLLKPGMFTTVELTNTLARERILAPRSAILDTGERSVAFVSLSGGRFEPRTVRTGVDAGGGMVEVLDGLKPGELVVTSGQFLIDSEAKMREALGRLIRGETVAGQAPVVALQGTSELQELPAAMGVGLSALLDGYFALGNALAHDRTGGLKVPAQAIVEQVNRLLAEPVPSRPHFWHEHDEIATVRGKALELSSEKDLEGARLAYADLSVALSHLIHATGVPPGYTHPVEELHCPMYRQGQGGSLWLQPTGDVRNPYFGEVMLSCFDERRPVPVTGLAEAVPAGEKRPLAGDSEGQGR